MCSAVTTCTCPKVTWLEGSHDLRSHDSRGHMTWGVTWLKVTWLEVTWLEGSHDLMSCGLQSHILTLSRAQERLEQAKQELKRAGAEKAAQQQELHKRLRVSLSFLYFSVYCTLILPPSLSLSSVATHQLLQPDWRWQTHRLLPVLPGLKNASYCIMVSWVL